MGNSKKFRMGAPIGLAILVAGFGATGAFADTLYTDIPAAAYYPNTPDFSYSVPFAEDQVSEFGGLITMSNGAGEVTNANVALSNWGTAAQYAGYIAANAPTAGCTTGVGGTCTGATAAGFYADVTLTLYNPGAATTNYLGSGDTVYLNPTQFASVTSDEFIDWRPASTAGDTNQFTCTNGLTSYNNAGVDQCGLVQLAQFSLLQTPPSTFITVPSTFIYGVSFGTTQGGSEPTDSLNLGINPNAPTEGSNPQPDTAYYSCTGPTQLGPAIACNGSFNPDIGWANIGQSTVSFAPEPATFGLIGFGLLGLGISARRKNRKS